MTLKQLEYVILTAEVGSFSEAAKKLSIEQDELYDAISGLELALDIGIFIPTQRGLALTPEGKELIGQAKQVVSQVARIEDKFLNHHGEKRLCSVSCQHYEFASEAMGLMARIMEGNFEFSLQEGTSEQIIDDVRDMRSEIGLLHITEFSEKALMNKLREARLTFHPLFDTKPVAVICAGSELAGREIISPEELRGMPFVSYEGARVNILNMMPELDEPYTEHRDMSVTDRDSLRKLIRAVGGYSICAESIEGDGVVSLPIETEEQIMVGWIEDSRGRLSDPARGYVRCLRQVIAEKGFAPYEED